MRIWTAEARAAQSALMKRLKPWTKSTGPRTPKGKAIASRNSYKTGQFTRAMRQARRQVKQHFRDCRVFLKFLKTDYYKTANIPHPIRHTGEGRYPVEAPYGSRFSTG